MSRYGPQAVAGRPSHPPVKITQEECDTVWKPAGWRLIVIGPTSTWRTEWGMWEAIRDIVQNCLDESETYRFGYDEQGLWIADTGKGVSVADFLLGPPVAKPDWARGKFGEGMKIGALAILRLGHSVHVETVGRELWIVFLEQKVNGRVEQLAALWKPNGTSAGTKFHIIGYNGRSYEEYFAVNLPRSLILAEVPSPITQPKQRYNQLFRAEGKAASPPGGRVYSRDIYFRDIKSPFSYNLWGFELAPDRHGPKNEMDIWKEVGRLWAGVQKVPLLAQFISMVIDPPKLNTAESRHVDIEFLGREPISNKLYETIMMDNANAWQAAWERVVGRDMVLRTDPRLDSMVIHLGYGSVSVYYSVRRALGYVIKSDKELIDEMAERLSEAEAIPDRDLTPRQLAHLNLARAIAEDFTTKGQVLAAIIPPASDMVSRTAGLYEFGTGIIKIHGTMLHSADDTVGVMVHEIGHHVAYTRAADRPDAMEKAADLTPEHSAAMEYVAGKIFRKVSEGNYDEQLKDATW